MKKVLLLLLLPILAIAAVSCNPEDSGSGNNGPEPHLLGYTLRKLCSSVLLVGLLYFTI